MVLVIGSANHKNLAEDSLLLSPPSPQFKLVFHEVLTTHDNVIGTYRVRSVPGPCMYLVPALTYVHTGALPSSDRLAVTIKTSRENL